MELRDKKILFIILDDLKDIEDALEKFQCNTLEEFLDSRLLQKCVVMSLINISESVNALSEDFILDNKSVNWKQFKKIRNIAAHKYGALNFVVIWNMLIKNITIFRSDVKNILK
jgi:uncharacterized protein with HEPN domain